MNQADPPSIDLTSHAWRLLADPEDAGLTNRWFADFDGIFNHSDAIDGRIGEAWQRSFGADFTGNIVWYATTVKVPTEWKPNRLK